ncbi:hypothetical protein ACFPM7_12620 [Actinokineospora guangxiensis]|uniref:Uncharacterized protein n=1 Tax=Actinokineospora guangxiensis TaxID=1490288 RepID=A0ABW0ENH4_9PSEU
MASQMSTPIFDELLREMAASTEPAPQPQKAEPQPKAAEAAAGPGGRRRKAE